MAQVSKDCYYFHNIKPERFQLYYNIIKTVLNLNINKVLEIGIGQGIVSHVLKFNRLNVVKGDFDQLLSPDVACDIRELPFKQKSFDLVLASEVLEHIPFADIEKALMNIAQLTKKYAVISVPFNEHHLSFHLNVKIMKYLYFRGWLNEFLERKFPLYFYCGFSLKRRQFKFDGEHYWEIGYKNYSLKKIRSIFNKYFVIENEFRVKLSPYHYVFVLKKRSL